MQEPTAHTDTFAADRIPPRYQWPEFCFDLPELKYPDRINCAAVLLDDAIAEGNGDSIAVYSDESTLTYNDLYGRSNRIAEVLTEDMDLQPGNRVLLRAPNCATLVAAWLGVIKAGGIAVTTMPLLRTKELEPIVRKTEISHALCDDRLLDDLDATGAATGFLSRRLSFSELDELMTAKSGKFTNVDTYRDDVCILAFTSGTTGEPKATMHFHRDVLAMADVVGRHLIKTTPSDIYAGSPPLGFTFGLGALLVFPLKFRAATALVETPKPDRLLDAVERFSVTTLFTAPTMYGSMIDALGKYDLSSLRQCVSAGEMLPKPVSDNWFAATGIRIIDGIGATEMMHIFISASGEDIRPGATGKALPGYQACILGDNDEPLAPGNVGRLAVKGPTGCRYLSDDRQKDYVVKGWNLTGDTYLQDEEGYYWFQGRADDMILSAGYNIAGPEVESALLAHPSVAACAVVGVPDEKRGNIVKAFVVVRDGIEESEALCEELQKFVKDTIAPYKYPREISFVRSLPKTQTGKIQRFRLREAIGDRISADT